jgi:hypothetical protein
MTQQPNTNGVAIRLITARSRQSRLDITAYLACILPIYDACGRLRAEPCDALQRSRHVRPRIQGLLAEHLRDATDLAGAL